MKIRKIILICIFAALMLISSIIRVPLYFSAIPAALQLMFCLTSGTLLGAIGGAASMFIYVCSIFVWLSAFASAGAGADYIFGPMGGFIAGFIPCAFLAGKLTGYLYKTYGSYFIQFASIFVSCAVSTIFLYFFGTLYFSFITGSGLLKAFASATAPSIWPDLIKIIISALITLRFFKIKELLDPIKNL